MNYLSAVEDFRAARRKAAMELIMARLSGRSVDLLSYEEVRQKLKAKIPAPAGLQDIPLAAIVGSVGRYTDFTRSFLPRLDSTEDRWARVKAAARESGGLPPIEVYRIGDAYFVRDGHHRVSVARQQGATYIQAYVTAVQSKVPLSPADRPDDLIIKAEQAEFLDRTRLDEVRPEADLSVTAPGQYGLLLEHIEVHRYFMGLDQAREIPFEEAVGHWYDEVYVPVVQGIRERGILREFPARTEADLYLWVSEHRAALVEELGWEIEAEAAAAHLAAQHGIQPRHVLARVGERVLDAITPELFDGGPAPGQWRDERLASRREARLFADILVAVSGDRSGWQAVEQAMEIARREGEGARVLGLHVVPTEPELESDAAQALQAQFRRRCQESAVAGEMALEVGKVARKIADRSRWADLVVVSLAHPPAPEPVARLSSGFRSLLLWCPRPDLAVPTICSPPQSALLAFDDSPKAREALFIAAYVAGQWEIPLIVAHVQENGRTASRALEEAQGYMESRDVTATYVQASGQPASAILAAAAEHGCGLILMGGHGHSPILDVVIGSTVDQVLREAGWPVLICR